MSATSLYKNFSKGIKQIFENSDETATIEEVYELFSNINEGNADLARIVSVLRGEDGAAETNLGIKQFGERFGRKFGLYQDKSNKLFLGVFAGLGNRLVRYSLRFLFLAVPFIMVEAEGTAAAAFTETLWGSVFWAYFLLYWVMVTAPPEAETKIVDWNIFPFAIQGEVSSLVISAIDRDPNFDLRLQSLKQMVGKVYAQRLIEHQARFAESTVSSYGELEEEEVYGNWRRKCHALRQKEAFYRMPRIFLNHSRRIEELTFGKLNVVPVAGERLWTVRVIALTEERPKAAIAVEIGCT